MCVTFQDRITHSRIKLHIPVSNYTSQYYDWPIQKMRRISNPDRSATQQKPGHQVLGAETDLAREPGGKLSKGNFAFQVQGGALSKGIGGDGKSGRPIGTPKWKI